MKVLMTFEFQRENLQDSMAIELIKETSIEYKLEPGKHSLQKKAPMAESSNSTPISSK